MPILITTEEQLEFAEDRYGLYISDSEKMQYGNISIASAFQEMKKQYPLSDYWYLIQYDEFSCGGYYYHADKVVINDDIIRFDYDEKRSPDEEQVTEVMCGFCHMAAIKKEKLEGKVFTNVIYPDKNDMSQNLNFSYHTSTALNK